MARSCFLCGAPIEGGSFCPLCGVEQPSPGEKRDPLIGQVLADRYEVLELVSAGGMGRVYRAVQRHLDRIVAVKVVHPDLVSNAGTGELARRFLIEARAASRLNHPNVVAVYDFGQAAPRPGAPLFLVMEFLTGPTLGALLERREVFSVARVTDVMAQVLAALGEAHAQGITHRDVKPNNIVLEKRGGGGDLVKVIDFGVARVASERRVTERGKIMGTPQYMAPEQIRSSETAPSVDLYSAGIILFELLTGRPPFDHESPAAVLEMHLTAARPDPRERAPARRVPSALAKVCMRAIAIDPAARFPDARSLAEAISRAASTSRASRAPPPMRRDSVAPHGPTMPVETRESVDRARLAARPSVPSLREIPLVGRDEHVAAVRELLASPDGVAALLFVGRPGTGRTRMLAEVAIEAGRRGALVIDVPREPAPHYERGYACLRALVSQAAGNTLEETVAPVGPGLRQIFAPVPEPCAGRGALATAVGWAVRHATERTRGALVVVMVDDVDAVDSVSREVLADVFGGAAIPGVLFVATCEQVPRRMTGSTVRTLALQGLSRAEARSLVAGPRRKLKAADRAGDRVSDVGSADRRLEPLYLEHFLRWRVLSPSERPPQTLERIVLGHLERLSIEERLVLQAIAVFGATTVDALSTLLPRLEADREAIVQALARDGWLSIRDGAAILTHAIHRRVAIQSASRGNIDELHQRAAEMLAASREDFERYAHHAIRGSADGAAMQAVRRVAEARARRGDDEGSIAALHDGLSTARALTARGDGDATSSGWVAFACDLAETLARAGHADQAHGILVEVLESLGPDDRGRVAPLELLARVAMMRNRVEDAARWRSEAEAAAAMEADDRPGDSSRRKRSEPATGTRSRPPLAGQAHTPRRGAR
jgi:serine/threonine-protein kinase